jgi:hypothetical protein
MSYDCFIEYMYPHQKKEIALETTAKIASVNKPLELLHAVLLTVLGICSTHNSTESHTCTLL